MSSLLQHHGGRSTDGRKVELLCYLVKKGEKWERYNGPMSYKPSPESTTFADYAEFDDQNRPVLYRFYRRPAGMFGCWVVFRYNGARHVPDLSIPIPLFTLPKGAERLTAAESEEYWTN